MSYRETRVISDPFLSALDRESTASLAASMNEAARRRQPRRSDPEYAVLKHLQKAIVNSLTSIPEPIKVAVDFGCGSRPYDQEVRRVASHLIGVDLVGNSLADITHIAGERVPLPDSVADLVVSFQVLEHIPTPQDYLQEVRRLLRPGGYLLLSTHGVWPYHPHPGDYHRWTSQGLRSEIEQARFAVRELTPVLTGWATTLQLRLSILRYTCWTRRRHRWPTRLVSWTASWLLDLLVGRPSSADNLLACVYIVLAVRSG